MATLDASNGSVDSGGHMKTQTDKPSSEKTIASSVEQSSSGQLTVSLDALRESGSFQKDLALVKEIEKVLTTSKKSD